VTLEKCGVQHFVTVTVVHRSGSASTNVGCDEQARIPGLQFLIAYTT